MIFWIAEKKTHFSILFNINAVDLRLPDLRYAETMMSSAVERKVFKALRPERPATRLLFNWLLLKTSLERLVTWLGLTFPTYFRLDLKNTRLDFFFNCLPWERRAYTACYKRGAARFLFYFRSPTVEHFQLRVIFFLPTGPITVEERWDKYHWDRPSHPTVLKDDNDGGEMNTAEM